MTILNIKSVLFKTFIKCWSFRDRTKVYEITSDISFFSAGDTNSAKKRSMIYLCVDKEVYLSAHVASITGAEDFFIIYSLYLIKILWYVTRIVRGTPYLLINVPRTSFLKERGKIAWLNLCTGARYFCTLWQI